MVCVRYVNVVDVGLVVLIATCHGVVSYPSRNCACVGIAFTYTTYLPSHHHARLKWALPRNSAPRMSHNNVMQTAHPGNRGPPRLYITFHYAPFSSGGNRILVGRSAKRAARRSHKGAGRASAPTTCPGKHCARMVMVFGVNL